MLAVDLSVQGWWEGTQEQTEQRLPAAGGHLQEENTWMRVHADQEYVLQVALRRLNLGQQRVSKSPKDASAIDSMTTCGLAENKFTGNNS